MILCLQNIHNFVLATSLGEPDIKGEAVQVPEDKRLEVYFLKKLIWIYVIDNPSLASHQRGQRRAIQLLFEEFNGAVVDRNWALFPPFFRERARSLHEKYQANGDMPVLERVRLVSDTISSMTDRQALLVYQQLTGVSLSSMLDPVVR